MRMVVRIQAFDQKLLSDAPADKRTQALCSKGKSKMFPADVAPRAARKLESGRTTGGLESAAGQLPSPDVGKQAGAAHNFN